MLEMNCAGEDAFAHLLSGRLYTPESLVKRIG